MLSLLPLAATTSNAGSTGATILLIVVLVAYLAFVISALVSVLKSSNYTPGLKALWVLAIFVLPFIGSVVWFIWGRNGN